MNLAVPVAGYFLTVLIIMFGGRKRRSFAHASYAAAGVTITILCLGALAWLLSAVISQFLNAEN
jgi:hypothetical protein